MTRIKRITADLIRVDLQHRRHPCAIKGLHPDMFEILSQLRNIIPYCKQH